jgi:hypothetical protein
MQGGEGQTRVPEQDLDQRAGARRVAEPLACPPLEALMRGREPTGRAGLVSGH